MIHDVVRVRGSSENIVTKENLEFHVQGQIEPKHGHFGVPSPHSGAREL